MNPSSKARSNVFLIISAFQPSGIQFGILQALKIYFRSSDVHHGFPSVYVYNRFQVSTEVSTTNFCISMTLSTT